MRGDDGAEGDGTPLHVHVACGEQSHDRRLLVADLQHDCLG